MKRVRSLWGLILFMLVWAPFLFSQQVLDRILAIVDDQVILQSDVAQGAYMFAMQAGINPERDPEKFKQLQMQVLDNLINQQLLLIKAEKDTIKADERQVEALLDQQMQSLTGQMGSDAQLETAFGMQVSKIRRNYRTEIEKNLRAKMVRDKKESSISVSRREVSDFFNTHKDSLPLVEEGVDLSHLLIEIKAGEEAAQKAYKKIEIIFQELKKGGNFEEMARDFSDDPGSARRGGDLGFMQRGDFVRDFEEVAFSLKPNEISDIVKTQFGYHVIQMIERRGEKIHVRHILASFSATPDDERLAFEKINRLYDQLQAGATFDSLVAAESNDASTRDKNGHLGFFELKQLEQTAPEFVPVTKSLQPNQYSKPFRTRYGFHILKLNRRRENRLYSLKQDWEQIENMALMYKRQKEYLDWMETLKKNVYVQVNLDD